MNQPSECPKTLKEWQIFFDKIYFDIDTQRYGDDFGNMSKMWLHLSEDSSDIARGIRKINYGDVVDKLVRVFCWYCSFTSKLNIDLDELIWHYFPYVCPTCYNEAGACICGMKKEAFIGFTQKKQKDENILKIFRQKNEKIKPINLNEYVKMFRDIYGNTSKSVTLEAVYLHFNEELGEVSRIIRLIELEKTKTNPDSDVIHILQTDLRSELADVFSYIANLAYKLDFILVGIQPIYQNILEISEYPKNNQIPSNMLSLDFEKIIWHKYKNGCPDCGQRKCRSNCPGFLKK